MPRTVFIYMQIFLHSPTPAKLALLPGKVMGPNLRLWLKGPTNHDALFSNLFLHTSVQGGTVANQFENNLILFIFPWNYAYNILLNYLIMMIQQFIFLI